jgi:hypothetical protein
MYVFSKFSGGYKIALLILILLIAVTMMKNVNFLSKYKDIILYFSVIVILFGVQFLIHPYTRVWIKRSFGVYTALLIGCGIFAYPVIRLQDDILKMVKGLKISALLVGAMYAIMSIERIRRGYWTYTSFGVVTHTVSNMSWSYGVLFVVCVCAYMLIIEKKKYMAFPVAAGLVGILLYGSRGTIISFAIGVVLTLFFLDNKKRDYRKIILIISAAIVVMFIFSDTGTKLISDVVTKLGWENSRFIKTFLKTTQGDSSIADESSGRDRIWKLVIQLIKDKPLGYGVMGHREYIYNIHIKWGYSHNIFLDILAESGVIIGSIVILLGFVGIARYLLKVENKTEKFIFIMFITVSCELLLSGYIWIHYGIWSILAIYMNHFVFKWNDDNKIKKQIQSIIKGAKK